MLAAVLCAAQVATGAIAMHLVSRVVSRVRAIDAHRVLVVVGVALLLAQSSRAQSLPADDAAPEAESQPATSAATQPASQPVLPAASAASTPAVVTTAKEPDLPFPWLSLGVGAASAGLGVVALALALPAAAVVLLVGNRRVGSISNIVVVSAFVALGAGIGALANLLLAPVAVGIGAVLDLPPGQDWWPRVVGAAAGFLPAAAIAGLTAVSWASTFAQGLHIPAFTAEGLASLALSVAFSAGPLALLCSPFAAPTAFVGVLLADKLVSPRLDAPTSAPATVGEE